MPYNDYDLAILELQDSAELNNYITNTVCLPHDASLDEFVDDLCYATGFGDTKGEGQIYRKHFITKQYTGSMWLLGQALGTDIACISCKHRFTHTKTVWLGGERTA